MTVMNPSCTIAIRVSADNVQSLLNIQEGEYEAEGWDAIVHYLDISRLHVAMRVPTPSFKGIIDGELIIALLHLCTESVLTSAVFEEQTLARLGHLQIFPPSANTSLRQLIGRLRLKLTFLGSTRRGAEPPPLTDNHCTLAALLGHTKHASLHIKYKVINELITHYFLW
jgi:hypothetical protein